MRDVRVLGPLLVLVVVVLVLLAQWLVGVLWPVTAETY